MYTNICRRIRISKYLSSMVITHLDLHTELQLFKLKPHHAFEEPVLHLAARSPPESLFGNQQDIAEDHKHIRAPALHALQIGRPERS